MGYGIKDSPWHITVLTSDGETRQATRCIYFKHIKQKTQGDELCVFFLCVKKEENPHVCGPSSVKDVLVIVFFLHH